MATATLEVWIVVDDAGDYATGTSADEATENYEANVQEVTNAMGIRTVCLNLTVPLPKTIELTADVPDTEGEPTLAVA